MSSHQSLTVILPVLHAEACLLELERQRVALEEGWAKVPGLISACLALLPAEAVPERSSAALLLECSFQADFADLMFVSFMTFGPALSAVLRHCAEYPEPADARSFASYLGSRARRSSAFGPGSGSSSSLDGELELGRRCWWVMDAIRPSKSAPAPALPEEELEGRRLAVGMQEHTPGVPLVHVAWLLPGSRERVKRALRELEHAPPGVEHDARLLLDGARLVFLAYPSAPAIRWSERLSQLALAACTRIWRNSRGFPKSWGAPRARRERRVQDFLLEHRIPVAAWFNARVPFRGARRES